MEFKSSCFNQIIPILWSFQSMHVLLTWGDASDAKRDQTCFPLWDANSMFRKKLPILVSKLFSEHIPSSVWSKWNHQFIPYCPITHVSSVVCDREKILRLINTVKACLYNVCPKKNWLKVFLNHIDCLDKKEYLRYKKELNYYRALRSKCRQRIELYGQTGWSILTNLFSPNR